MRFVFAVVLSVVVGMASVGGVAARGSLPPGNAATLSKRPVAVLMGRSPVSVLGLRFVPGEKVAVTVWRSGAASKRVAIADRNGRFFVRFTGVRVASCSTPRVAVYSYAGTTRVQMGAPNCMAL